MKAKRFWIVGAVLATATATAALLWFSKDSAAAYTGLASRFPAGVDCFVEVRHLGQWLDPVVPKTGQPSQVAAKGQDPLLRVIGSVWAAERIEPKDLPEALRDQPLAIGLWREGKEWKGAALLALSPGLRNSLEELLKEKLGEGTAAGDVEGVPLRQVVREDLKTTQPLLWGVGDEWAVISTGLNEARMVLAPQPDPLASDPVFLETASRFPLERGAWLFLRGKLLADLASDLPGGGECAAMGLHPPVPEPPQPPSGMPQPPPPPPPSASDAIEGMAEAAAGDMVRSLVPPDGISALALWSAPPVGPDGAWEIQAWVGSGEERKGVLKVLGEGGSVRPRLLQAVPQDAALYVWIGGDDPARLYQSFLDETSRLIPADKMATLRAAIGAAEGKLGVSISNDLLPCLGDEAAFAFRQEEKSKEGVESDNPPSMFISLRDARRLEHLLQENVGPSLAMKAEEIHGVKGWVAGGGDGPGLHLLLKGQTLVLTMEPDWALSSGNPSRAWTEAKSLDGEYSALFVADPSIWDQLGKPLVVVTATREKEGCMAKARIPGIPPKIHCEEKGDGEASIK